MDQAGIVLPADAALVAKETSEQIQCRVEDGRLTIGKTSVDVHKPINRTMIPDIVFYDNAEVSSSQVFHTDALHGIIYWFCF